MPQRGLRAGAAAGLLGAILIAAALAALPELPAPSAGDAEVFAFFLDDGDAVSLASALLAAGSLLLVVLLATTRVRAGAAGRGPAGATMLSAGSIAVAGQCFYAAALAALAARAEDADPATARVVLDLAEIVAAFSGLALAVALTAAGIVIRRPASGLPARLGELALLTAVATGLWSGRLFTETGILAADGFAGSTLGSLLVLIWAAATALWIATEELEAETGPGRERARGQEPASS